MGVMVLKALIDVKVKHCKFKVHLSVIDELLFHEYQKEIERINPWRILGEWWHSSLFI